MTTKFGRNPLSGFTSMMVIWVTVAVVVVGLISCVTPSLLKEPMPAVLDPFFNVCAPADGSANVQIFQGDTLIGSGDLAWLAKSSGDWEAEIISPLGQTLLRIKRQGAKIDTKGQLAPRLMRLQVDRHGFLEVNDHFIGIKASEVPCLLGYRLPRSWLTHLTALRRDSLTTTAAFHEEKRTIALTATGVSQGQVKRLCNQIHWSAFLGLYRTTLDWCQDQAQQGEKGAPSQATLSGFEDYMIKWIRLDEP